MEKRGRCMNDISGAEIFCMALAALMFSLILIPSGSVAIGVEEGDWAKYEFEVEISEEMYDWVSRDVMEETEELEWLKVVVESVSDTTVTLEGTMHFKNGTEKTETIEDGIESGFIIEADLGEGDEVTAPFFDAEMTGYINGTVSRTYAGASREVNYVVITVTEHNATETRKAYWDKATGFICEMSVSLSGEHEGETVEMSISYKMTETNLWAATPLWMQWWFWAIVIAGIAVLAGGVYLLKKGKPPTAPPLPPEGTV